LFNITVGYLLFRYNNHKRHAKYCLFR
jgi:hypothetical protein